jgi:hypothetical protein
MTGWALLGMAAILTARLALARTWAGYAAGTSLIQQQSELRSLGGFLHQLLSDQSEDGNLILHCARRGWPRGAAASVAEAATGWRRLRRFDGLADRVAERHEPVPQQLSGRRAPWMNRIGGSAIGGFGIGMPSPSRRLLP